MDSQLERPIGSIPEFWLVLAGVCLLGSAFITITGYMRYKGGKYLYPPELLYLWILKITKGKERREKIEKQMEKNKKHSGITRSSTLVGTIGFLFLAMFFVLISVLMANTR